MSGMQTTQGADGGGTAEERMEQRLPNLDRRMSPSNLLLQP